MAQRHCHQDPNIAPLPAAPAPAAPCGLEPGGGPLQGELSPRLLRRAPRLGAVAGCCESIVFLVLHAALGERPIPDLTAGITDKRYRCAFPSCDGHEVRDFSCESARPWRQ